MPQESAKTGFFGLKIAYRIDIYLIPISVCFKRLLLLVTLEKHLNPMVNEALRNHPPEVSHLGSNEVHVWWTSLDFRVSCIENLKWTLTPEERARAKRFYFQRDHDRFIAARGLLRVILGYYLNAKPSRLEFCYNHHGKPYLAGEFRQNSLRFNLSRSHEVALYAVCRGREIGVDIERIEPEVADEQIAEHFFSPLEVAKLDALPSDVRHEAFFKFWTRKEAYLKASGVGLSLPIDGFDVSLVPEKPAALLSTRWDPKDAVRWSLQDLDPLPGYAATLAVRGGGWCLKYWQLPESMLPGGRLKRSSKGSSQKPEDRGRRAMGRNPMTVISDQKADVRGQRA